MLVFERVERKGMAPAAWTGATLTLGFERRRVSRQRAPLDDGREAGLCLPRGTALHAGDLLATARGERALVLAAEEELTAVGPLDPLALARAAYHLGNRHVYLMIGPDTLRYPADAVLDRIVAGLGFPVRRVTAKFEPEGGVFEFLPTDARLAVLGSRPEVRRVGGTVASRAAGAETRAAARMTDAAPNASDRRQACAKDGSGPDAEPGLRKAYGADRESGPASGRTVRVLRPRRAEPDTPEPALAGE